MARLDGLSRNWRWVHLRLRNQTRPAGTYLGRVIFPYQSAPAPIRCTKTNPGRVFVKTNPGRVFRVARKLTPVGFSRPEPLFFGVGPIDEEELTLTRGLCADPGRDVGERSDVLEVLGCLVVLAQSSG